jgi:rSAM/selenodomain-associated transferase 1
MARNILGLTVKFPEPGKVKTRLARDIGDGAAADVYARIARRVLQRTTPSAASYERMIFYSPSGKRKAFEQWFPTEDALPQKGGGIGRIMQNALSAMFEEGAEKAVVAGVDIPGLNSEIIRAAFAALDSSDLVIGPAMDGGYYLIGMKAVHPELFHGIRWSTAGVLEETLAVAGRCGLSCSPTETLYDIDTIEDLLAFLTGA